MPVRGPAHYHVIEGDFIKQEMLLKWSENHGETPLAQTPMRKTTARPERWIVSDESTRGFDRRQVVFGDLPTRVDGIPIELPFDIGDKNVRFADIHRADESRRCRTRSRIPSKSAGCNGVAGRSAAVSNHASSSGVISTVVCC